MTKAVTLKSDPIPRLICLRIGTRMLNYCEVFKVFEGSYESNSLRNLFYECFIVGENPFNTFDCIGRQLINFFDVLKMKTNQTKAVLALFTCFSAFFF